MESRKFKPGDKVRITFQFPFIEECFNEGEVVTVLGWIPYENPRLYPVKAEEHHGWETFCEEYLEFVE